MTSVANLGPLGLPSTQLSLDVSIILGGLPSGNAAMEHIPIIHDKHDINMLIYLVKMVLFHSRASNHQRLHPQLVGGSTCSLSSRTSFQGYSGLHFGFVQGAPVRNREKVGEQFTPISLWFLVSIY